MKLIPLSEIPYSARATESTARAQCGSRDAALEEAQYHIVAAPGCHGRPYFDPPSVGWTITRQAAEAYTSQATRMPDGTSHRRATIA